MTPVKTPTAFNQNKTERTPRYLAYEYKHRTATQQASHSSKALQ